MKIINNYWNISSNSSIKQNKSSIFGLSQIECGLNFAGSVYYLLQQLQKMSVGYHSERKNISNQPQDPSKVLLVCVYDTLVLDISNEAIYEKFYQFGNIVKLLIFQKRQITKFFIEFAQVEQAIKARNVLDGSKLCGTIGKMSIYYSNFSNVDLKNQTTEGADYSYGEEERNHFLSRYELLTKSSPEEDSQVFNDLIMQSFDAFSPFSRSKTDKPDTLCRHIQKINLSGEGSFGQQQEVDFQIKSSIHSILDSNSNSSKISSLNTKNAFSPKHKEEIRSIGQFKIKQASKSKNSLLVFDYNKDMQIRHVYNLFSNFGNIASITKKKTQFFIRFRTIEFASISYTYLSNYWLMGNVLKLYSPESQEEATPRENQFSECIFFDASFDRFTPNKSITINSPSLTLHISSLKRDICRQKTLFNIFQQYGQVNNVQILKQSADKNMALVKFYNIEDSFRAIAQLHNSMFSGRKMQISFTKSRVQV